LKAYGFRDILGTYANHCITGEKMSYKYKNGSLLSILSKHNNISASTVTPALHTSLYTMPSREDFAAFMEKPFTFNIISDSDCDGLSSLAIFLEFCKEIHVSCKYTVLDRANRSIEHLLDADCANVLLDCGSSVKPSSYEPYIVMVIDHHEPAYRYDKDDVTFINSKLHEPPMQICGAGLTYLYTTDYLRDNDFKEFASQYAAIGTIADMVDLLYDNRSMVIEGLHNINHNTIPSIGTLLKGLKITSADETSIAFYVAPVINAASRYQQTRLAIDAYINGDSNAIRSLIDLNNLRKEETKKATSDADVHRLVYCNIVKTDYPHIAGLVATRFALDTKTPTMVFSIDDDKVKFSIRSANRINVSEFLRQNNIDGGGHAAAGGGSIHVNLLPNLYNMFIDFCKNFSIDVEDDNYINLPIKDVYKFTEELQLYRPYGQKWQVPMCKAKVTVDNVVAMGVHQKLSLSQDKSKITALYFYPLTPLVVGQTVTIGYNVNNNGEIIIREVECE
jgi:single-stranded-DNA-specific exonuclease